jgi:plastocyanin
LIRAAAVAACACLFACGDDTGPPVFDLSMPPILDFGMTRDFVYTTSTVVSVGPGGHNVFAPSTVTINAGDGVTWNLVTGVHQIVLPATDAGPQVISPVMDSGRYVVVFANPGTYGYHCGVHGTMMTGTVIVR